MRSVYEGGRMVSRRGFLRQLGAIVIGTSIAPPTLEKLVKSAEAAPPPKATVEAHGLLNQQQGTYNFSGTIEDVLTGEAVKNAELIFKTPDDQEHRGIFTDDYGNYTTSIDMDVEEKDWDKEKFTYSSYNTVFGRDGTKKIRWSTPRSGTAKVKIYNILSQLVDESDDIQLNSAGRYEVNWQPRSRTGYLGTNNLLAKVEIQDSEGKHELVDIKLGSASGNGAGFLSSRTLSPTSKRFGKPLYTEGVRKNSSTETWTLKINKQGEYYERETPIYVNQGSNTVDESMLPESSDLEFFDEVSGRNQYRGTQRWTEIPKLYLIDGQLEGYSGFETPTQEEINRVISTWKEEMKDLSKNFIDIPDENIYIGHDVNDPIFQEAVKQIVDGAVLPDTTDGKRWDISLWTNMLPGSGGHSEIVEDGVIKGAVQRYRPGMGKDLADIESAQSCGFPVDPADPNERYDYANLRFTDKFLECGKYNYSRTPNTFSPDRSIQ